MEKQREVEEREQRERRELERIESLKKKEKHEQSAVASSEVKQKLQVGKHYEYDADVWYLLRIVYDYLYSFIMKSITIEQLCKNTRRNVRCFGIFSFVRLSIILRIC